MKKRKTDNWKHIDSSVQQQLNVWNEPAPVIERIYYRMSYLNLS